MTPGDVSVWPLRVADPDDDEADVISMWGWSVCVKVGAPDANDGASEHIGGFARTERGARQDARNQWARCLADGAA